MASAKAGKSTLGIPQSVGADFMAADPGGKLPAYAPKKKVGKPSPKGLSAMIAKQRPKRGY
jgi:hypothetical protein